MSKIGVWLGVTLLVIGMLVGLPPIPLDHVTAGLGLFCFGIVVLLVALGAFKWPEQ